LTLAAVIATAGVIADSTATVIGAMIVAPLMTPILGTALAVGLAERRHVVRSVGLVATGTFVLLFYKVRQAAEEHGYAIGQLRGRTLVIVIGLVVIVAWLRTSGSSVRSMRGTASSP
jgi:uncharacterized membrane protein